MKGCIQQLTIYPVKSCAGIAVDSAKMTPFGLEGDRQWMIVDESGRMLTQRANAKLALIQPSFSDKGLVLSHPNASSIEVKSSLETTAALVWRDSVSAFMVNQDANDWITEVLGSDKPLRLVKFDSQKIREPGSVERFGETGKHFADAAPYLVANEASLSSLNGLLCEEGKPQVTMRAFRPNIVVSGIAAFDEHAVSSMVFNSGASLVCVDHCQRCIVITIDPDTGVLQKDRVPYDELASMNGMPNKPKAAAFGVNATFSSKNAALEITIGDSLEYAF